MKAVPVRPRLPAPLIAPANLISASRFLFAGLWIDAFPLRDRVPSLLLWIAVAAAISDMVDGPVARHHGATHMHGRWLDNLGDIFFVSTALICEAHAGTLPVYVPLLVLTSFTQYAVDSIFLLASSAPVKSRIGHWGGIVNFGLILMLACASYVPEMGIRARAASPLLGIFYVAGIFERLLAYPWFKRVCTWRPAHSIHGWLLAETAVR
jgi:phosphatidylglycerophosphate synthase